MIETCSNTATTYDYSVLKSKNLFDLILGRLKSEFEFVPDHGIIAGQSVASAIYSIVGVTDRGPYRDLDVFIEAKDLPWHHKELYERDKLRENHSLKRIKSVVNSELARCSYDGIFDPICKNGYQINGCLFIGRILNYVLVNYDAANVSKLNCIVDGFDINCCEAGIDLREKTVYWTQEFESFLRSFEIKITNYLTPAHTIVRAAKKSSELKFANFSSHYISQAQTVRKYIQIMEEELEKNTSHKGYFCGHMFSEGYLSRFEKQKDMLGDHFYIAEKSIFIERIQQHLTFYNLSPKSWDGSLINKFRAFFAVTKSPELVESRKSRGYIYLENDLFYINEITKIITSAGWKREEFFTLLELASSNSLRHEGVLFLFNILFSDRAKLLKAMTNSEKIRAAKLIGYHELLGAIQHLNWTVDEIRLLIKNLTRIDKDKYRFIIRDVEKVFCLSDELLNQNGVRNPEAYTVIGKKLRWLISDNFQETLDTIYQNKINSMDPTVLPPIFDTLIAYVDQSEFRIVELLSEYDVFFEGIAMQHCVGGYWYEVANGSTFVLSVKGIFNKNIRCTLQLDVADDCQIKIVQNQTYRNTEPRAELKSFCENFVRSWNNILSYQPRSFVTVNIESEEALREKIVARKAIDRGLKRFPLLFND